MTDCPCCNVANVVGDDRTCTRCGVALPLRVDRWDTYVGRPKFRLRPDQDRVRAGTDTARYKQDHQE